MALPWVLVFFPWAGALALALIPPRLGIGRFVNIGLGLGSLLIALTLFGHPHGGQGWIRVDALNLPFIALAALIGLTTSVFSAASLDAERFDSLCSRAYHLAFQVFVGAQFLALLSDNLGVMWVAIEIATAASVLMVAAQGRPAALQAAWKFFILGGLGLALALFGTTLLYLAAQPVPGAGDPGLSWEALRAAAAHSDPGLLGLAFVFLLVGYGTKAGLVPLHAWLPDAEAACPLPVCALLSGLLLNAALLAILRAAAILGAHPTALPPGPFLIGFGLLSLLVAAFSLWRRGDARRLFAWSSIGHVGLATLAFGIGGAAANLAGLLHLLGHALVKSAVCFALGAAAQLKGSPKIADISGLAASHPALGWGLAFGIAGLAGMPPFALFVSEFRLLTEAAARHPWLIAPLGLGLLVGAAALLRALQALCLGPPTPDRPMPGGLLWASLPVWLHLALAAALGFALPGGLAALLRAGAAVLP